MRNPLLALGNRRSIQLSYGRFTRCYPAHKGGGYSELSRQYLSGLTVCILPIIIRLTAEQVGTFPARTPSERMFIRAGTEAIRSGGYPTPDVTSG